MNGSNEKNRHFGKEDLEQSMLNFEKVLETKMPVVAALKNDERKKMRPFGALQHENPDPAGHFMF